MLRATKPFTYATRRLKAGDTFEPRNRTDRRVLLALRRAEPAEGQASAPSPSPKPAPAPAASHGRGHPGNSTDDRGADLAKARAEYHTKFGKRPFNGWDADTIRAKVAAG